MIPGWIVVLNGAPRSGKTSIARALIDRAPGPWVNLGVDAASAALPSRLRPGIGLRPGGERPDLEPLVETLARALFASIAAHSKAGVNVAADLGLHESYSGQLSLRSLAKDAFSNLPVLMVGVHCPIEEIMRRRNEESDASIYARAEADGSVPIPVQRWQQEVHKNMVYDCSINTAEMSPEESAGLILSLLNDRPKSFNAADSTS